MSKSLIKFDDLDCEDDEVNAQAELIDCKREIESIYFSDEFEAEFQRQFAS